MVEYVEEQRSKATTPVNVKHIPRYFDRTCPTIIIQASKCVIRPNNLTGTLHSPTKHPCRMEVQLPYVYFSCERPFLLFCSLFYLKLAGRYLLSDNFPPQEKDKDYSSQEAVSVQFLQLLPHEYCPGSNVRY